MKKSTFSDRLKTKPEALLKRWRYAIITPVKDEENYIENLIRSVINQTFLPVKWIIIDDGSQDATPQILNEYAEKYSFINVITLPPGRERKPGGDTVFEIGLQQLNLNSIDILARIDADVTFDPDYIERMIEEFEKSPELGIASGEILEMIEGVPRHIPGPSFQTHGANKFYRVQCFRDIGGLDKQLGWDIVDNIKAMRKGWEARRIPHLFFVHHRPMGSSRNKWAAFVNWGKAAYLTGYHPLYFLSKFIFRIFTPPYLLGSLVMAYHYLSGFWRCDPRIVDDSTRKFIQKEQLKRLLRKKSKWD